MAVRARVCEARANSSISSRLMSHFSAIISARAELARPPGRRTARSQPGDSANGVVKPYCWATSIAAEIGIARHVLQAAGDDEVLGAGHDALRGEVHGLLRGAALPVDGHAGHVVGQPGDQPGGAGDVAGLRADGVAAAHDHVVDGARVDAGALDEGLERRARRGRRSASRRASRRACRPGCGRRRRCRPQPCVRSLRAGCEVLVGDLVGLQVAAGAVPADRDPDGVAQEPVDELDVEVGAQLARRRRRRCSSPVQRSRKRTLRSSR